MPVSGYSGGIRSMINPKSEATMQRLTMAVAGDTGRRSRFARHDGPTLLVAAAIYASWMLLLAFHKFLPWWIMAPVAGYVVQWHFSLQHEAIHSMRGLPKWLRLAIVWPPIGGWFPFELYRRSHSQHHRNTHPTYPGEDTESFYHEDEDWEEYGELWRWVLIVNQTFLGRLFVGPLLRTPRDDAQLHRTSLGRAAERAHRGRRIELGFRSAVPMEQPACGASRLPDLALVEGAARLARASRSHPGS
jgi:fatty acid desaturase